MKLHILSSALLALAASSGAPSQAQFCTGSDNLQGPCCAPTFANLPNFPPLSLPGLGICWQQCNPTQQPPVKVATSPPVMTNCAQFTVQLSVTDPAGVGVLGGVLRLDYTRTWFEIAPVAPGGQFQVWRFMVKGDLMAPAAAAAVCPAPACIGPAPSAFFYGYLDYALDCITGNWTGALVIYHGCDRFMHKPGISAVPGAFHPGTSYAVVAPTTTVNPFVPSANPFPSGPLVAEAVRDVSPVLGAILCRTEERLAGGLQQVLAQGCACPLGFGIPQHSANFLQGQGSCPDPAGLPSMFTSINLPAQPWLFEVKSSIGTWTNPAGGYPGDEVAWVDEGVFTYHDSCAFAAGNPPDSLDIFYGASTIRGFPVLPSDPGVFLTDKFIDMASNFSVIAGTPAVMPAVNLVLPTRHLIYVNLP